MPIKKLLCNPQEVQNGKMIIYKKTKPNVGKEYLKSYTATHNYHTTEWTTNIEEAIDVSGYYELDYLLKNLTHDDSIEQGNAEVLKDDFFIFDRHNAVFLRNFMFEKQQGILTWTKIKEEAQIIDAIINNIFIYHKKKTSVFDVFFL